jgi:hypothetical protein
VNKIQIVKFQKLRPQGNQDQGKFEFLQSIENAQLDNWALNDLSIFYSFEYLIR